MTLDTDLSRKPYFDDYDQEKDFYKVLYRPGAAVQTRELNQMQSILQDQLDKFGRSIYKEGSVIEGCAFSFDNNYRYVKIEDTFANGGAIASMSDFEQKYVVNSNGLRALIVDTLPGFEAQDPNLNTLYLKYLNSASYPNGSVQSAFNAAEQLRVYTSANNTVGNVNITTVANSVGIAYGMTVTEGVIFKKGFFLRVAPQTVVVSRYSNVPDDISVGFNADEVLVTPEMDTTLLDNAAGSPNEDAPGAHRLRIIPSLTTRTTSLTGNTSNFFSLVDFKNGLPVTIKNDPQYVSLNKELARRTFETNGDYVVDPFILSTSNKASNDALYSTHLNLVSSPGIGYVKGYRVEFINNNTADLRKGLDYASLADATTSFNLGYYILVNEYSGDFNNQELGQIELHSTPKKSITDRTFLSTGISSTTKIGTAYCRSVAYDSGIPGTSTGAYRLYLSNITMDAGKNFSQVRSVYRSSGLKAFADIVLQLDASGNSIAAIQDPVNESMLYAIGPKSVKPDGYGSTSSFTYRKRANSSFNGAGTMSITLPTVGGSATEQMYYTGSYGSSEESRVLIIPTTNSFSTNNSGNVAVYAANNLVFGTSTSFLTQYNVGDYIAANTGSTIERRRITSIVSNLQLYVDAPFVTANGDTRHQKFFPAGAPINFSGSSTRTITANSSTITFQLGTGDTPNNSSSFQCSVYYDVARSSTYPVSKVINRNTFIKIDTANNAGGARGPWCLGIPDVFKVNAVYVGATYDASNANRVASFSLDNGQRDSYYGLAQLSTSSPLPAGSKILVSVDNFTYDRSQGRGFFTAASYPIDDANTANTAAIQTIQIPVYVSTVTSNSIDLRDVIDARPYVANTANAVANTAASATINPANTFSFVVDSTHGGYLPTPGTIFKSDVQYYLPRKDRVALTQAGDILITEGEASTLPIEPMEVPGTMTIGLVEVSPYPSLTPADAKASNRYDHSVKINMKQTQRYTMADIGKFDNRISRLEYYTSLNLLEQSAVNLQVRSDVTGKNRFQNGFFVDPFQDHSIGNTTVPGYSIAIDGARGEARPKFSQFAIAMYLDESESSGVQRTGDIVTLPYTSTELLTQAYGSAIRKCIEGNIFQFNGTAVIEPNSVKEPDITRNPAVVSNQDLNQNWVNLSYPYGTQWGNWSTVDRTQTPGSITQNITSTSQTQTTNRTGASLNVAQNTNEISTGSAVINISLERYVPETTIAFTLQGMRPSTRIYAYVNNVKVYMAPLISTTSYGAWDSPVTTDAVGFVQGAIAIPKETFSMNSDLEIKFVDVPSLSQTPTTKAITTFFTSMGIIAKIVTRTEVDETRSIQNVTESPPSAGVTTTLPSVTHTTQATYTGADGGWVEQTVVDSRGEFDNVTGTGQLVYVPAADPTNRDN